MKVEKVNENKIKITLTYEELEARKISIAELEKDTSKAKDLFFDIIEEFNEDNEFELDDSQLFIEATADNNNLFIVTITKVEYIPELKKYSLFEEQPKSKRGKNKKSNDIQYRVQSNMYLFNKLDNILNLCDILNKSSFFIGKNSLYKYNNKYFLIFSKSSIKNPKFVRTFSILSEYCDNYYSYDMLETSIKEKSQLIIENKALQKLSCIGIK